MKAIRSLAAVVAVLTLAPATGMAQNARPFQNSWYWGLKGGGTFVSSPSQSSVTAGMVGIDWLITHERAGLYVSFDQSFLSQYAILADSVNAGDTPTEVNLKDMRRLSIALMAYPGDWQRFHPYAGLGMVYAQVGSVKPLGTYASTDQYTLAQQIITAGKSVFSPMLMLGAQMDYGNTAIFVQAMGWQGNQNFLLSAVGSGANGSVEVGLRYNFGTSIAQDR